MTVEELVAACSADALAGLDDRALARFPGALVGLWPRLEAARLRVIATMDDRHAYTIDGARDMTGWLAWKAGDRRSTAHRDIDLAATMTVMPAVEQALGDGSLSKAKAVELGRLSDAPLEDQAELVAAARSLTAEQVARQVDRWQLEHRAPVEVTPSVQLMAVPGGGRVEATLDGEGFEWVQVAIDTAAGQLAGTAVPFARRRAAGLVGVCRYFLDHADTPTKRQGRPTIVVTINIDTLTATTGGSGRTDSGAWLTGDTARRLACDAGLIRMITDPDSMPLDVGRRTRTISPAQARAVIHRDRHCRFEGCTAPEWACDVHHIDYWGHGGRTDLHVLALLCWHHHTQVHNHQTTHHLIDHGDGRLHLEPQRPATQPAAA